MQLLSGGPRVREYLTGVTKMTEQRNSRIALLAVVMLLSGAFLGLLVSDNASAARYDLDGFVSDNNSSVSITILDRDSGYDKTTTTLEDGYYTFSNVESGNYDIMYEKDGYLSIRNNLSVFADGNLGSVTMVAAPSGDNTISGTIKDQDDAPITGATITLFSTTTNQDSWWGYDDVGYSWSVISDGAGTYEFTNMPETIFDARVTSDDHYTHNAALVDFIAPHEFILNGISDDNLQEINVTSVDGGIITDATIFMYEESTSTWTDAIKFGGAKWHLSPNTGSTVYVYAYHEDHKPTVAKLSDVISTNSFEMVLGSNNLGDDDVVYLPSTPSLGSESSLPMIHDRIVKLNLGPTAKISSTTGDFVLSDTEVLSLSGSSSISLLGDLTYNWPDWATYCEPEPEPEGEEVDFFKQVSFGCGENTNPSVNYSPGTNSFRLIVTDIFGATDTVSVNVTLDSDNPLASFTALAKQNIDDAGSAVNSTNVIEDATTVVFNASASSDATSSVSLYSWDFGDGNTDTGKLVSHSFETPGDFNVVLTVADGAGNEATTSLPVSVHDVTSPNVVFNWSYVDSDGEVRNFAAVEGIPVNFNAGLTSDNSGRPLTYEWDFSDGTNKQGKEVTHTFENNISSDGYEVILVVTDESNNSNQESLVVSVQEKDRPDLYISQLTFSNDNPKEDETIQLNAALKLLKMNITENIEVSFYLDNLDNQIGSVMVDGSNLTKGPNGGVNVSVSWKAISGKHTIFAVADSTDLVEESEDGDKNNVAADIDVQAKETSNDTSIILLILVVVISIGAVGYIYKDSLFGN